MAVRSSTFLVVVASLPVAALFWTIPDELVSLLSSNELAIDYGARYLRIVGLGIPFAGLNLVGSRVLVGSDDAYTAMQLRAGGAVANIVLSAALIFGLEMGVEGAALGTVLSNVVVVAAFALGLVRGGLPVVGAFPVRIDPRGTFVDPGMVRDLVVIGFPVMLRNLTWTSAEFPLLRILDMFGQEVVAAFVIARRIWGIMNTPGWGFGLAASSLVGQSLGEGDEEQAEDYGRDIVRFAVATYAVSAVLVAAFADRIVVLFANDPTSPEVPIAISLVYAACVAVTFRGVAGASAGPLDASGDTRITFVSQFLGLFGGTIPLAYLGATTSLGLWGVYLGFLSESAVPAAINYWRFRSGAWKAVSESFRPDAAVADD